MFQNANGCTVATNGREGIGRIVSMQANDSALIAELLPGVLSERARERRAVANLAEDFRTINELTGKKQIQVCRELGIPRWNLCRWLSGKVSPQKDASIDSAKLVHDWAERLREQQQHS
jgi:hypothetical protein